MIAASCGLSVTSKKTEALYLALIRRIGPEFYILREAPIEDVQRAAGPYVAEGIRRLRAGEVERIPGYDGEYGTIKLLDDAQRRQLGGQVSILPPEELFETKRAERKIVRPAKDIFHEETAAELLPERTTEPDGGFDGLNGEQHMAVTAPDKTVAVIAGPGTGKTKTLVSKIAYLIERLGVKPSEITAVTFTNKAAGEMRERLEKRLGGKRAVCGLTVGTFHAVCLRLLQEANGSVAVIDEADAIQLAEQVIKAQKISMTPAKLLREVSRCKQSGANASDSLPASVFAAYEQRLADTGVTDLDGLLTKALTLWEEGAVTPVQARRFHYLLVDEFQDINDIQYQLVRVWSEQGSGLFVIGDPDQAIYGFRGANPRCFAQLLEDDPTARRVYLTKNYRSTPQILSCALAAIARPTEARRGRLCPSVRTGKRSAFCARRAPLSEGIFVAKQIGRLVGGIDMLDAHELAHQSSGKQVYGFSDIAVLYRTHRQAELLETCLRKEGIPYVVMGRDDFLNDRTVRTALCFFSHLIWPQEEFYFNTFYSFPARSKVRPRQMNCLKNMGRAQQRKSQRSF